MTTRTLRGAGRFATPLLVAAALIGCGGTPAPEPADEDLARATLERALGAWTSGETVDGIKAASPSITVSEPKWARGDALLEYEIEGDGQPSAAERVFHTKLRLKDRQGKERVEWADYRVGTDPLLTVFRSVF